MLQFGEFYLYDANGNRIGAGLSYDAACNNKAGDLAAGSCCVAGGFGNCGTGQTPDKLFDGDTSTAASKLCVNVKKDSSDAEGRTIDGGLSIVMHLSAPALVKAYNFRGGGDDYKVWARNLATDAEPVLDATLGAVRRAGRQLAVCQRDREGR